MNSIHKTPKYRLYSIFKHNKTNQKFGAKKREISAGTCFPVAGQRTSAERN